MSNLESSWEETVVKLAQAGNLRAVAFWLNRHLVAQGICVQATTSQPGQLTLQILCRQAPDREQLVNFIGQRIGQLNSPVIRSVQFKAQLIGSSELLWTQTVNLAPVSPSPAIVGAILAEAISTEARATAREADRVIVPQRSSPAADPVQPVSIAVTTSANRAANSAAKGAAKGSVAPASEKLPAPSITIALQPAPPKSQPRTRSGKPAKPQSLKRKTAHWLKQSQQQMQRSGRQLQQSSERSIQWFQRQKPRRKAVILGSSAIAAFLLGCGFELVRHQVTVFTARMQNPEAAASGASYEGMVKTAIEQVPVVQLPAANPDDPTVTLLFSNAVTLSQASSQTGITAQRNADMVITSLNAPLAGLPDSVSTDRSASPASPLASTPEAALSLDLNQAEPTQITESSPASNLENSDLSALTPSESSELDASNLSNESYSSTSSPEADLAEETPPVNLPPLTLQQLQANRVSVVNLASNQLIQPGSETLNQTIKSLSQVSIYPIGAGTDQQSARRPQIFSIKDKRIAYLGYSDVSLQTAGQSTAGLNTSINAQVEADIKSIRDQVDWVIVSYHWNQNLRSYPEDWQINITHAAIDHGADLVVGYHPTVTQGAEVYGGRAIVYSLGSMLDPYQAQGQYQNAEPSTQQYETLALKLSLQDQQMQLDLLPVSVSNGQTEILTAETGASILEYLKQASSLFRQPLRSPTTLDTRIRLTLPAAPNSDKPFSEPFTSDPAPTRP